ncbi:MAG: hypothetical protein R2716_08220 [Microthrixaceae bacterium]
MGLVRTGERQPAGTVAREDARADDPAEPAATEGTDAVAAPTGHFDLAAPTPITGGGGSGSPGGVDARADRPRRGEHRGRDAGRTRR